MAELFALTLLAVTLPSPKSHAYARVSLSGSDAVAVSVIEAPTAGWELLAVSVATGALFVAEKVKFTTTSI